MTDDVLLSVIIISRNIEKYIGKCIESVLDSSEHIENKEVILVDSASTDNTLEIARRYPIKIVRTDYSAPLSASAGRYIGFLYAKGRYLHFQDGDSILDKNWFKNSLPFIEKNPGIAGVTGFITQEEYDNFVVKRWIKASERQKVGEIEYYEEDVLIRRSVLENVGAFNPWLRAMEEGELSYRMLNAGFKLYRLQCKMSHHLGGENENLFTFLQRKVASSFAVGKSLRYSLKNKKIFWGHVRDSKFIVLFSVAVAMMLISSIPAFMLGSFMLFHTSVVLVLITYLWVAIERRDTSASLSHIFTITLLWPFLISGFLRPPKKPSEYPTKAAIIKS